MLYNNRISWLAKFICSYSFAILLFYSKVVYINVFADVIIPYVKSSGYVTLSNIIL